MMLDIPDRLQPMTTERIVLPDHKVAEIPKSCPSFKEWDGEPVADSYGGKAVLDFHGEPLFAELLILRHLELAGWEGCWVDSYQRKFRRGISSTIDLPQERQAFPDRIYDQAQSRGGCFDVYAWNGFDVLFAEAKRADRDRIRDAQI